MSYQALYRKYRPQIFDDIVGQDTVVRTLKNQIRTGRIGHAYLFCGSRGTGKTTAAKIFARAVNCEDQKDGNPCQECASCRAVSNGTSMSVVEVDAASRNGVEQFRTIIDEVQYPPTDGKYKVYIIDEVHMLSAAAFNAFLKTLEEPPSYVIFILATTDPQKLPATILSRCQRYDFRRIPTDVIVARLKAVLGKEGVGAEEKALRYIARKAEGGMRDALSIADQCLSYFSGETLTYEKVLDTLGTVDAEVYGKMLEMAHRGNVTGLIRTADSLIASGRDIVQVNSDFIWYLRDLLLYKASEQDSASLDISEEQLEVLHDEASRIREEELMRYIRVLSEMSMALRNTLNKRVQFEIGLIRLCRPQMETDTGSLLDRVRRLEQMAESGALVAAGAQQASGANAAGGAVGAYPAGAYGPGSSIQASGNAAGSNSLGGSAAGSAAGGPGAAAGVPGSAPQGVLPTAVAPESLARVNDGWQKVAGMVKSGLLRQELKKARPRFRPDREDTLYVEFSDWIGERYIGCQDEADEISDIIGKLFGFRPKIVFLVRGDGSEGNLSDFAQRQSREELIRENVNFDIEEDDSTEPGDGEEPPF